MKLRLGRYVYGAAAISFGVIALIWRHLNSFGQISHPEAAAYVTGIVELLGGFAILWRKTMMLGALILAAVFMVFSVYWIPPIIRMPLVFGYYGNFFEQFSMALGGIFVFAAAIQNSRQQAVIIEKAAYICFGICVVTYSLYQLFYLRYTAGLVPKWIPPGQMFWAVATTIAFALAAAGILLRRSEILAATLLTAMLVGFGVLVWVPACILRPHQMSNWVENASNLSMTGTAWIVVDYLVKRRGA